MDVGSGGLGEIPRKTVFDYNFIDQPNSEKLAGELIDLAIHDQTATVVTPNVDILINLHEQEEPVVVDVYRNAQYCLPDGQPIVWASKLVGKPLSGRLAGSSLFERLWPMIKHNQIPVTIVASSEDLQHFYQQDYNLAAVEVAPILDVQDDINFAEFTDSLAKSAASNGSRMLVSGIGQSKDAHIIQNLKQVWHQYSDEAMPLFFGLGASAEFYAGTKKRAPLWMRKAGLEWLHRFSQDPGRLFHRYFVRSPRFVKIVFAEWRSAG